MADAETPEAILELLRRYAIDHPSVTARCAFQIAADEIDRLTTKNVSLRSELDNELRRQRVLGDIAAHFRAVDNPPTPADMAAVPCTETPPEISRSQQAKESQ